MNSGELLSIHPQELQFPFELNKQISCNLQITNQTDNYIAFKVKTTNPKKYCVRPNTGIVLPHSVYDLLVTMQAQKEAPADMQCKDRFLLQSVITSPETTIKDITSAMFNKESGNLVEECKLKVSYVSPPQPEFNKESGNLVDECKLKVSYVSPPQLSPSIQEVSDGGSFLKTSESDYGILDNTFAVSRAPVETPDDSSQTEALIYRLTEEKNSTIQLNNKLHQEMERLRLEISRRRSGIPFLYIIIVGLIGILIGYLMKRS